VTVDFVGQRTRAGEGSAVLLLLEPGVWCLGGCLLCATMSSKSTRVANVKDEIDAELKWVEDNLP